MTLGKDGNIQSVSIV